MRDRDLSQGDVSTEVVRTVAELPGEWATLCTEEQVALSPELLRAFEAAQVRGVKTRYLVASRGGRPEAGAALHRVEILLEQQRFSWTEEVTRKARLIGRPDLLRFRAIMCGLNASQGRDDIVSGETPPSPDVVEALARHAEGVARKLDLDGVIFAHLHEDRLPPFLALRERGYILLPSLPYATMHVRWSCLEEYLGLLRAGYRRQAASNLRKRDEAGIETCVLDLDAHADELHPLYLAVVARAEQRIEVLPAAFFHELARASKEARLVGLRRGGRLVAGAAVLRRGSRLVCLDVGLDYSQRDGADLYHNLLLALVDHAGRSGAAHLDLGQTAAEAKARLGARLLRTWLLCKPRSPLIAAALRVERPHLRPEPLPSRRVFRDEPAGVAAAGAPAAADAAEGTEAVTAGGDWARYVNPDLAALLALFRLDRIYVRGEGIRLKDSEGREVLDLTSGYGALPFGHNPAWVWDAVTRLRERQAPQLVQGALAVEAGQLARELCRRAPAGIRYAVFANSGAEAVEVALKAARAATRRPLVVVCEGAFHGKTLGALSATPSRHFQEPFFAPAPGIVVIPYGDARALEGALEEHHGRVAAFLVEPILGEGGIVVPPDGFLSAARELCHRHGALLLLDEVQTGLGRAGRLFACEEEGVAPDAIALSKALGGGLLPVAACLLSQAAWTEELALRHSSTFAGNALGATVGLEVLYRLTARGGALLAEVRRKGDALRGRLRETAARCPALAEVRGRGLMVGLEVGALEDVGSPILRHLAREQKLIPLLCGYLLAEHGVRVMPPLSRKTTLRIIAPLDAPDEALERTALALDETFARLQRGDVRGLSRYLLDGRARSPLELPARPETEPVRALPAWRPSSSAETPAGKFLFLLHPVELQYYRELEPSLAASDDAEVADWDRLLRDLVDAVELSHVRIRSAAGAVAEGWFAGIPFTARGLVGLWPHESLRWLRAGMALARAKGADVVGLGAFTAVVTGGGIGLKHEGPGITTGNAYTVSTATQALLYAAEGVGLDARQATCAVIGASGSIGRLSSLLLAPGVRRLILVGNPAKPDALARLESLADEIRGRAGAPVVECTVDAHLATAQAELLLSTTSAVGPVLEPHWLRSGAVVCDVARPNDVSSAVRRQRDDVLVIDGGVVQLPDPISLGWDFGFEPGHVHACMAETILLALDGHRGHFSLGPRLSLEQVAHMAARAEHHGFRVAGLRSFGRPVSPDEIKRVRSTARRLAAAQPVL